VSATGPSASGTGKIAAARRTDVQGQNRTIEGVEPGYRPTAILGFSSERPAQRRRFLNSRISGRRRALVCLPNDEGRSPGSGGVAVGSRFFVSRVGRDEAVLPTCCTCACPDAAWRVAKIGHDVNGDSSQSTMQGPANNPAREWAAASFTCGAHIRAIKRNGRRVQDSTPAVAGVSRAAK
jgi:hypothetical protein